MAEEHWSKRLERLGVYCQDGLAWVRAQPGAAAAWQTCERGDWMLWVAAMGGADRRVVALAACGCARLALEFVPNVDEKPLETIEAAERWAYARGAAYLVEAAAADAQGAVMVARAVHAEARVAPARFHVYAAEAAIAAARSAFTAYRAARDRRADAYVRNAASEAASYGGYAAADAAYQGTGIEAAGLAAQARWLMKCAEVVRGIFPAVPYPVRAALYPEGWPMCMTCGEPALDGHLTCGRQECDERGARERASQGEPPLPENEEDT